MSIRIVAAVACGALVLGVAHGALAQIAVSASNVSVDFAGFTGAGIVAAPSAGQLSSLAWSVTGLSDGNLDFGANGTSSDFGRGTSTGGVTNGGIYAFDTGGGHVVLGLQPTDADFTPGSLSARFKNALARPLLNVNVSYKLWVFADEAHSSSFDFSWSTDNVTFTSVPALDFTTDGPIPTTAEWRSYDRATTLALNVAPGGYLFLRWTSDDAGGTGGRDEIGLDAVTLNVNAVCGDGHVDGSEACDDGNQDNTDGCLTGCVLPRCGDGYVEQGVEQCDPTLGSSVDPACCSLACLFTAGNSCTGGLCQNGQCVPSVAGGGGMAGGGTAGGGTGPSGGTAGAGGTAANGGATSAGGAGEAGEGGVAGDIARGGTGGSAQGGASGHTGKGGRPPKGFAGSSTTDGGSNGANVGGTSTSGGSAGAHASATGGSSAMHGSSGGSGGTHTANSGGTPATGGASATGGATNGATGGGSAASGGMTGTAGAPSSAPAQVDNGCSCSVPRRSALDLRDAAGFALLALSRIRRRSGRHLKTYAN